MSVPGFHDLQKAVAVKLVRKGIGETGRHMLDDYNRSGKVRRKPGNNVHQCFGTACRSTYDYELDI